MVITLGDELLRKGLLVAEREDNSPGKSRGSSSAFWR